MELCIDLFYLLAPHFSLAMKHVVMEAVIREDNEVGQGTLYESIRANFSSRIHSLEYISKTHTDNVVVNVMSRKSVLN